MLENSQLLCLRPVEILNPIKFEAVVLFINTAEGKQRNYLLFIHLVECLNELEAPNVLPTNTESGIYIFYDLLIMLGHA